MKLLLDRFRVNKQQTLLTLTQRFSQLQTEKSSVNGKQDLPNQHIFSRGHEQSLLSQTEIPVQYI